MSTVQETVDSRTYPKGDESPSTSLFWLVFSFAAVFGGLTVLLGILYIISQPGLMQLLDTM